MPEIARRQFLSFTLDRVDCAVGILQVKEILQCETISRVPSVPRSVRGVINLRGAVVPVVDLSLKLGLRETPISRRTCILVVEARLDGEPAVLGVLADSVSEVLDLADADIEPPPTFGARVEVDYLTGMGKVDGSLVLLIDLDRALSAEEKELAGRLVAEEAAGAPLAVPAEASAAVPPAAPSPGPAAP
jgi:purine-binding chemotaxis protein CheW